MIKCLSVKNRKLLSTDRASGLISGVFTDDPIDSGSISRSSHAKDSKMVLDVDLFNTQHYKVRIKGKVEQSKELSRDLPYISV